MLIDETLFINDMDEEVEIGIDDLDETAADEEETEETM